VRRACAASERILYERRFTIGAIDDMNVVHELMDTVFLNAVQDIF
jgi:hypothetical protein